MKTVFFLIFMVFSSAANAVSLERYDALPDDYKHVYVRAMIDARLSLPVYGRDFSGCLIELDVEGVQHEYKKFLHKEKPDNGFKAIMKFSTIFNMLTLDYCGEFADEEERSRYVDILGVPTP